MAYWRLHYHLIWATYERLPTITVEREKIIYSVLYKKAEELELKIHAAGNIEDHIYIVLSIPPKISVADCIKNIKGASSYAINHTPGDPGNFKWQEGYAALSLGDRSLETVMNYAARQKEHHRQRTINPLFEKCDD